MTEAAPSDIQIVNIVASSYSGATWVNLVLGSHPRAFSVGEIDRMLKIRTAFCTIHGKACTFWPRYDMALSEDPYVQIARLADRRMLVVNNTRLLLESQKAAGMRSKFIFLIRDGRAVAASTRRKYPEVGMWRASRNWARAMRKKERMLRRQPPGDVMRINYEAIAAEPEKRFTEICAFLGVDFSPAMLEYWKGEHHFLGGNMGAMAPIAREQNAPVARADKELFGDRPLPKEGHSQEFYQKSDAAKFVDDRWKKELTDGQLRLFALAAGRLNRRYGYPRALVRG